MLRRASPTDCALITGIQRLHHTLAANDLAAARRAESQAQDRLQALERQIDDSVHTWSAYLGAGAVDPEHLQRLAVGIAEGARQAAVAGDDVADAGSAVRARSEQLGLASANLKQAEALTSRTRRQVLRKADERAARELEDRGVILRRRAQ